MDSNGCDSESLKEKIADCKKQVARADEECSRSSVALLELQTELENMEDYHPRNTPTWQALKALADVVSGDDFPPERIAADLKKAGLDVPELELLLVKKVIPVAYIKFWEPVNCWGMYEKTTIDEMYDYNGFRIPLIEQWAQWRIRNTWIEVKRILSSL